MSNANYPDFTQYFIEKADEGVGYHIEVAGVELEYAEELLMDIKEGDIIITPVPAGSKGVGKIIAAIAIVVIMDKMGGFVFFGNSAISFGTALGASASTVMGKIAIGVAANLAIAGVQEMMAPDPSVDTQANDESILFNGAQQNIESGDPVPVLYGRLKDPGTAYKF